MRDIHSFISSASPFPQSHRSLSFFQKGDRESYMVQSVLGEGAWATVYLVAPTTAMDDASPFAMKVVFCDTSLYIYMYVDLYMPCVLTS